MNIGSQHHQQRGFVNPRSSVKKKSPLDEKAASIMKARPLHSIAAEMAKAPYPSGQEFQTTNITQYRKDTPELKLYTGGVDETADTRADAQSIEEVTAVQTDQKPTYTPPSAQEIKDAYEELIRGSNLAPKGHIHRSRLERYLEAGDDIKVAQRLLRDFFNPIIAEAKKAYKGVPISVEKTKSMLRTAIARHINLDRYRKEKPAVEHRPSRVMQDNRELAAAG